MTTIIISQKVYRKWKAFEEWDPSAGTFEDYLLRHIPGLVAASRYSADRYDGRKFQFETEDHLNWFLLHQ